MALTNPESERLYEEARLLYERYGELKAELRVDRSRRDVLDDLDVVQSRYESIVEELSDSGLPPVEDSFKIPDFDVGHYRAHRPVVPDPPGTHSHFDWLLRMLKPRTVITVLLAIFLVSTYILTIDKSIGFFVVPSSSMEPTLVPGDKLITFRKSEYLRGDIVVLRDPLEKGAFLVKRLVALENDDVYVTDGTIRVNSKPITETYMNEPMEYEFDPYRIPEGFVFVLGDNRNHSDDGHLSRQGISKEHIVGEVRYIYAPRNRAGAISSGSEQFTSAGF